MTSSSPLPPLLAVLPAEAAAENLPELTIVDFLKSSESYPLYLLIALIVYMVQLRYCNLFRVKHKPKPLKKEILKSLPTSTFSPECGVRLCSRCVICLEDYKAGDMVRVLPHCGHEFHAFCIDKWFQLGSTCPSCRSIPVIYHPYLNVMIQE